MFQTGILVIKYMKSPFNKSKIVVNNIEHLLIKEYYIKYLSKTNDPVANV